MRKLVWVILTTLVFILLTPSIVSAAPLLRYGSRGQEVVELQNTLARLGYFNYKATGYFGKITKSAVMRFQDDYGLSIDGIVGPKTLAALENAQKLQPTSTWKEVDLLFPVGTLAVITDCATGLKFIVQRFGGRLHADVEPKTSQDTAIMKSIVGHWTWNRRPIEINIGGTIYPASMNAMPHGGQKIYGNNFNGHFCVHFVGSKLHKNGRIDPKHQAMIIESQEYLDELYLNETIKRDYMLLASRGYIDRSKIPMEYLPANNNQPDNNNNQKEEVD